MSDEFRELLKKVGSGPHTSKDISRDEAKQALSMMLNAVATPAQIGAFLISHRIKRPTGEELAGFLDALDSLGPQVPSIAPQIPVVLSNPYDGRSRTAPISPITSLLLAAADIPVVMHGSDKMPTKYGIPNLEVWSLLGVNWQGLSLEDLKNSLETQKLGFLYMGDHFPEYQSLIPYRDQLGKRPPLATAELLWCPYAGESRLVSGYVHPPTEAMLNGAFHCRQQQNYTTVKGLEGSVDLARDRTAIIGIHHPNEEELERLLLHARDYGLGGQEVPYESPEVLSQQMEEVLAGQDSKLLPAVLWNGGFYLWRFGSPKTIEDGIELAKELLTSGQDKKKLEAITQHLAQR